MTIHFDFWTTDEDAQMLFDCITVFIHQTEEQMWEYCKCREEEEFFQKRIDYLKKLKEMMKNEYFVDKKEDRCQCSKPEVKFVEQMVKSVLCKNCHGNLYPVKYEEDK